MSVFRARRSHGAAVSASDSSSVRKWMPGRAAAFAVAAFVALAPALAQETLTYSYDARGRLVRVVHAGTANDGVSSNYNYDDADNRTGATVSMQGGATTLTLSPNNLPNGTVGTAYSETVTASGGSGGYSYAKSSGTLPAGLVLHTSTGVLSGTPTSADSSAFTISATDSSGGSGSHAYTVTIAGGGTTGLTLTPATLPNGAVGTRYVETITATGGTGSGERYTISAGSLPPGLDLRLLSGRIVGTPTTGGSYDFTVHATDNGNNSGSRAYTVAISGGGGTTGDCAGISFAAANDSATEGANLAFTVTKTGSTGVDCSVDYATSNGTAATADYTGKSGTLTFTSTQTSKSISVATTDDSTAENDETVRLTLSSATNGATISDSLGIGTINDNDAATGTCSGISFSVSDDSVAEGSVLGFTVTKAGTTSVSCSVSYATADGTAIAPGDYSVESGTLTFTSAQSSKSVSVSTVYHPTKFDKTMYLNLSSPGGGSTLSDGQAVGTIIGSGFGGCITCTQSSDPVAASTTDTTSSSESPQEPSSTDSQPPPDALEPETPGDIR
jgi:YD repeat-containing protein